MKKNLRIMFSILFLGSVGISVYSQGTWKADSTMAKVDAATEISVGITGLTVMHSDVDVAQGVVGKPEKSSLDTTYNDVHWDNLAFIQGVSNGMYYAIRTASEGSLDIAVKMGSGKKTFILELTDACPNNADLAALTTGFATGDLIFAETANFALPTVFDTYNRTEGTWDGLTAIQSSGASVFMFMSFPVAANKTYVVGCMGSKMMLRGINYKVAGSGISETDADWGTEIYPNPAQGKVFVNTKEITQIGIYSVDGSLLKQQLVTPSANSVDISELVPGMYFIKDMNQNKTQKLIVK